MYKFVVTHPGLVENVALLAAVLLLAFVVFYLWPQVSKAWRDLRASWNVDPMVGTRYARSYLDRI
jgi:hypothetical protein